MADHIVHIGLHKTGTSWLQRRVFPNVVGAAYATGPLFKALNRNLVFDDTFYAETYRAAVNEIGQRVLLSWECFASGNPFGMGMDADLIADRVKSILPQASIILVLRERESLIASLYAQYVQEGGFLSRIQFERGVLSPTYLDFDATIARYRSRFDRVLVVRYEQLKQRPGPTLQNMAEFGEISFPSSLDVGGHANVSLRGWRLAVLRRWNRWFRASDHNATPPLPIPYAGAARCLLQRKLKPRP